MLPVVPVAHQIGIGNQDARRIFVRAKNADGLAGLHEKRFVVVQAAQRSDDGVKTIPVARGLARAAIDDQILRTLGDVGIEIVH